MRNRWVPVFACAVLLLVAASSHAGTLTSASWLETVQGFPLTRTFNRGLSAPPFTISGSSTGAASVAVNLTYPDFAVKFFVPKTANGVIDLALSITQGGTQSINATPGGAAVNQGVPGTFVVRIASHAGGGVNQSMYATGMTTLLKVPLNVGTAGVLSNTFMVTGITHFITVDFYAWTAGSLGFTGLTSQGQPLPSVTAAGSWGLTPNGGGTVTLVSPTKISIDGALAQRKTVSFATVKLYFVPEPSVLLLLGAGALSLGMVRRRVR